MIYSGKPISISKNPIFDFNKKEKEQKDQLLSKIKDFSIECGQRSSIHGIPSLTTPNVHFVVKLLWIGFCLASWALFAYQIYSLSISFLTYSVVSSVSVNYEAPSTFPAVDICNLNPYNGFTKGEAIDRVLLAKDIHVENSTSLRDFTDMASKQFKAVFEFLSTTNRLDIYKYGFFLNEMLVSCQYQGKKCSQNDFYWYHDYNYGNCFRFNGGDKNQTKVNHAFKSYTLKRSTKPGWRNGLRLEFYTGDQETQQQYNYKSGIRVIVHNQSIVPFPDEDGIDVAVGTQTNVAISRTFMYRLPYPFSNCIQVLNEIESKQNEILFKMYELKKKKIINLYQQNICLKICEQKFIFEKCGCFDLTYASFNIINGSLGCLTTDQVNCLQEYYVELYNSYNADFCYSNCPFECDTFTYKTKISTADYPTKWYFGMFKKYQKSFGYDLMYLNNTKNNHTELTLGLVKSTTAMVNIYYDTLTYTVVKESPALSFDILLANVGGNFGLFTGASILSFVEFIEICASIFIIYVTYKEFYSQKR